MLTALLILVGLWMALGVLLWTLQERLIFLPDSRRLASTEGPFRLEELTTEDGLRLRFLAAQPSEPGRAVVLLFQGNGGNAADRMPALLPVVRAGYGVVLAGYRGYGGNPGRPSAEGLALDAQAHLDWVRARWPAAPVVLWGESLGSGVATRLAEENGGEMIAALVLDSPFTSVADLAATMYRWLPVRLLLRHPFESLARLSGITAPLLVVHAEGDRVVPVAHGRQIATAAQDGRGVFLPGDAHPAVLNDPDGRALRAVLDFLAGLPEAR